ncbi:VCBS repeat-containing protein [candidate division KSB1 bacterium]|nr:VCBS repeat-containing protein [candidate division KSB1 bacterium]
MISKKINLVFIIAVILISSISLLAQVDDEDGIGLYLEKQKNPYSVNNQEVKLYKLGDPNAPYTMDKSVQIKDLKKTSKDNSIQANSSLKLRIDSGLETTFMDVQEGGSPVQGSILANGGSLTFPFILNGDISGTDYVFRIYIASLSTTQFRFEIIVDQQGSLTTLANTIVTAIGTTFMQTDVSLTGPDPTTIGGNLILCKITRVSGAEGGILFNGGTGANSFVEIPEFQNGFDGDNNAFRLAAYNPTDLWVGGATGIRGVISGSDVDQDGKYEIIVTNYNDGGKVHVYEVVGDDEVELVWSSPGTPETYASPCRYVQTGDLDGNGLGEIVIAISEQVNSAFQEGGIHVYEWDGVTDNGYGSMPIYKSRIDANLTQRRIETFVIDDIDLDGKQELVLPNNGPSQDDIFYIASIENTFSSGSATWVEEKRYISNVDFQGDPMYAMVSDLDGDGLKEVVCSAWSDITIFIVEATAPNTYVASSGVELAPASGDVSLMQGAIADLDNDGKDEAYVNGLTSGNLYVITGGDDATNFDASKVFLLSQGQAGGLGMAAGDQDHGMGSDGGDIYVGTGGAADIVNFEFIGNDVTDSTNYARYVTYRGLTGGDAFVAKLSIPEVDLDQDGKKEMVLAYQSIPDTVGLKKWFRIIEFNPSENTLAAPTLIAPPNNATGVSTNLQLSWNNVNGAQSYNIQVSTNPDFTDLVIDVTGHTSTLYEVVGLSFNLMHYWRVSATNNGGISEWSSVWNFTTEPAMGIEVDNNKNPHSFSLNQNYPNPFNPETTIQFEVPKTSYVTLAIYNLLGMEVKKLISNNLQPGAYKVTWDASTFASGVYIYKLQAEGFIDTKKLILMK